jgi:hypothetical protein
MTALLPSDVLLSLPDVDMRDDAHAPSAATAAAHSGELQALLPEVEVDSPTAAAHTAPWASGASAAAAPDPPAAPPAQPPPPWQLPAAEPLLDAARAHAVLLLSEVDEGARSAAEELPSVLASLRVLAEDAMPSSVDARALAAAATDAAARHGQSLSATAAAVLAEAEAMHRAGADDAAAFSRFALLSLSEPSAATLARLGLASGDSPLPPAPRVDADSAVQLLSNAFAGAVNDLGGLVSVARELGQEAAQEARASATLGHAAAALEGAAQDAAAAAATLHANAAAAALRLRSATELSGEDLAGAAMEAATAGRAHAHAAAQQARAAAAAELSAVAAQASTVAAALASESAQLEDDVTMRASEVLARGTGMAEAALEEAAASAAAVLSEAAPRQRALSAEADAAALLWNEYASDIMAHLRDSTGAWSDDLLDAQIALAASADAAYADAAARAAEAAADLSAAVEDAMDTGAAAMQSAQESRDAALAYLSDVLVGEARDD